MINLRRHYVDGTAVSHLCRCNWALCDACFTFMFDAAITIAIRLDTTTIRLLRIARACFQFDASKKMNISFFRRSRIVVKSQLWYRLNWWNEWWMAVDCLYRLVGSYSLYAQQLVRNGELSINEPLVDSSNRMLEVHILMHTYTYIYFIRAARCDNVTAALMFCCCFFLYFFIQREISAVSRPIAARLCYMIGNWCNFKN